MEHLITVKMRYPTTTFHIIQSFDRKPAKVKLLNVHGTSETLFIYTNLIKANRSLNNVEREQPMDDETISPSKLLATFPSRNYATLNVKRFDAPFTKFWISVRKENGVSPFFKEPITISLKMTAEGKNDD